MLLKDDTVRPSMSEILASDIVQKHMGLLIQSTQVQTEIKELPISEINSSSKEFSNSIEHTEEEKVVVRNVHELLRQRKSAESKRIQFPTGKNPSMIEISPKETNYDRSSQKDYPSILIKTKKDKKIAKISIMNSALENKQRKKVFR